MESLDNLQKALDIWEQNVSAVEQIAEETQGKLNEIWAKDTREELRKEETEQVRAEAIGEHGGTIRAIREGADEIRADIERYYSRDAVVGRSVLSPGESFAVNLTAEMGLRQRLAEAPAAELLAWADSAIATRNYRLAAVVKAEAGRRTDDKALGTQLRTRLTELPEHPDVAKGAELVERANMIANRATWSREKLDAMQGGRDAKPPQSEAERLKRKALEVRELVS